MAYEPYKPKFSRYTLQSDKIGWKDVGSDVILWSLTDNVGIGTADPNEKLTVLGNISASSVVYDSTSNSVNWGSVYETVYNLSAFWTSTGPPQKVCPPNTCIVVVAPHSYNSTTQTMETTLNWTAGGMQVVSLSGNVPLSSVYTTTNTNTFKVQNSAAGMTMSIRLSAGGDPAEYAVLKYPDGFKFVSHPFDIMKGGTVAVLTLGSYKEDEVVAAIAMEG